MEPPELTQDQLEDRSRTEHIANDRSPPPSVSPSVSDLRCYHIREPSEISPDALHCDYLIAQHPRLDGLRTRRAVANEIRLAVGRVLQFLSEIHPVWGAKFDLSIALYPQCTRKCSRGSMRMTDFVLRYT